MMRMNASVPCFVILVVRSEADNGNYARERRSRIRLDVFWSSNEDTSAGIDAEVFSEPFAELLSVDKVEWFASGDTVRTRVRTSMWGRGCL